MGELPRHRTAARRLRRRRGGRASSGDVETHLERCPPCRGRAATERAAHELLVSRRAALRGGCARGAAAPMRGRNAGSPPVAACCSTRAPWCRCRWPRRSFSPPRCCVMFGWGSSVETYAAQLADDHVEVLSVSAASAVDWPTSRVAGQTWQDTNGWPLKVAGSSPSEQLQLLGVRGAARRAAQVAHLLYSWRGAAALGLRPQRSVVDAEAQPEPLRARHDDDKRGEQAVVWTSKGRTYAVVAGAAPADLDTSPATFAVRSSEPSNRGPSQHDDRRQPLDARNTRIPADPAASTPSRPSRQPTAVKHAGRRPRTMDRRRGGGAGRGAVRRAVHSRPRAVARRRRHVQLPGSGPTCATSEGHGQSRFHAEGHRTARTCSWPTTRAR